MAVFVFQSVPERYDLRQAIVPGATDTWYATRYRGEMSPGSLVFFWMAGDENFRGLYGWGHLISAPYVKAGWDGHGIDVAYEVKFQRPILARTFRDDPALAQMLIFRAPQATNFLLSDAETRRLFRLIQERGERAPGSVAP
jgi:hypothetical protein